MKNLIFSIFVVLFSSIAQAQTNVTWDRYNNEQDEVRWESAYKFGTVTFDVMQDFTKKSRTNLPDGDIILEGWLDTSGEGTGVYYWSGFVGNIQGKKPVSYWIRTRFSDGSVSEWVEADKQ